MKRNVKVFLICLGCVGISSLSLLFFDDEEERMPEELVPPVPIKPWYGIMFGPTTREKPELIRPEVARLSTGLRGEFAAGCALAQLKSFFGETLCREIIMTWAPPFDDFDIWTKSEIRKTYYPPKRFRMTFASLPWFSIDIELENGSESFREICNYFRKSMIDKEGILPKRKVLAFQLLYFEQEMPRYGDDHIMVRSSLNTPPIVTVLPPDYKLTVTKPPAETRIETTKP